jgi:hypothetical protein
MAHAAWRKLLRRPAHAAWRKLLRRQCRIRRIMDESDTLLIQH